MTELAPSYLVKISRAKKHLADLKAAIAEYSAGDPYEAAHSIENKKQVWRLRFRSLPVNTQIPVISADLIYNLRSGLEHLAAALNPRSHASSVGFPIFWARVWEPPVEGENDERIKHRQQWDTYTRMMHPEAVAILKRLQPEEDAGDKVKFNTLSLINNLSNTDRHKWFPVHAAGLYDPVATQDGVTSPLVIPGPPGVRPFLQDGAKLVFPKPPVQVQIKGTPLIAIRRTEQQGHIDISETFELMIRHVEFEIVPRLIPYVWVKRPPVTRKH